MRKYLPRQGLVNHLQRSRLEPLEAPDVSFADKQTTLPWQLLAHFRIRSRPTETSRFRLHFKSDKIGRPKKDSNKM
jgi:hypothetical protein